MIKILTFILILSIKNLCLSDSAKSLRKNFETTMLMTKSNKKVNEAEDLVKYDLDEGEMMLSFAAATYATKKSVGTKDCLDNINMKHKADAVHFGRYKKARCDIFKNTCSVDISIIPSRQEIIIAFEGTNHHWQLLRQAYSVFFQNTIELHGSEFGKVNRYYLEAVNQLWIAIESVFTLYPEYAPVFVGHSMGGCLASIAALIYAIKCKENAKNKSGDSKAKSKPYFNEKQLLKIKQFTFGEPRHGNELYARKHNQLIPHSIRYVNEADVIAQMPFCSKFQIIFARVLKNTAAACEQNEYIHQGQEIWFKYGMRKAPIVCRQPTKQFLEDFDCSASQTFYLRNGEKRENYISDHQNYFNNWVYFYGEAGCSREKVKYHVAPKGSRKSRRKEPLKNIYEEHNYNMSLHI